MKSLFPTVLLIVLLFAGSVKYSYSAPVKHDDTVSFPAPWTSAFHVDPVYKFQFVNAEGTHLFLVNKTAWAYFECEYPGAVLRKARQEGVNVIRVCLEGTPYQDHLHLDMWPWGGTRDNPKWNSFNSGYWDNIEKRIRLAGEYGIGIDLVLYFNLEPGVKDVPDQKPYWDYAIGRLSKYSNLFGWEIMNEESGNEAFQDCAGTYFRKNDPFSHLVFSSDGTTEDALWPRKPWMDVAIVHTCTGNQPQYDLKYWYLDIARNTRQYGKPAFNNESGRERRHKNDDPVFRRKQSWLWTTAGAFWTWHSWEGCEGINDTAYFGPGWQFLKPVSRFYNSLPYWELAPNYTVCVNRGEDLIHSTLSTPDRSFTVMYCCTRETGATVTDQSAVVRIRDGNYSVNFISPVNLEVIDSTMIVSTGLRQTYKLALPGFTDDMLVLITNTVKKKKSIIKGSR
ncbi:MAG TPA: DUF4038 domain-containing protein [Bacteroidales bacterium]|nr:DUF4038 domain-containing protein [Bacteroidales bacterium]